MQGQFLFKIICFFTHIVFGARCYNEFFESKNKKFEMTLEKLDSPVSNSAIIPHFDHNEMLEPPICTVIVKTFSNRLRSSPLLPNIIFIDSNYLYRSIFDCFFASNTFADFLKVTSGDLCTVQNLKALFDKVKSSSQYLQDDWLNFLIHLKMNDFDSIESENEPARRFINKIGRIIADECEDEAIPKPDFISSTAENVDICKTCRTFFVLRNRLIFCTQVRSFSSKSLEEQLEQKKRPLTLTKYTERFNESCKCENLILLVDLICISNTKAYPKLLILSFETERIDSRPKVAINFTLQLQKEGKYKLFAFVLKNHSDYSSVFLKDGKWIHSKLDGMWDVTENVVSLLEQKMQLAFYERID